MVNIYGPNNDDSDFFLDVFSKIDDVDSTNLIVGGDLNLAIGPLDYKGSPTILIPMQKQCFVILWKNTIY